jgi:hypothetical protein
VESLIEQRFPYEDFWRVLANEHIQREDGYELPRSWDTGNWWAMLKLENLDKEESRKGYYSAAKAVKISEVAGNLRLSAECEDG